MKTKQIFPLSLFVLFAAIFTFSSFGQAAGDEPWTEKQLMAPADLARIINDPRAKQPVVFSIGPQAIIKNSVDIGPAKEKENLQKLKQELVKLSKDADIVIYCGCCPFEHCPNIRPAFQLLNQMKFTNHKLLNLPKNIKVDWIDKGYPKNN
jgi:hypothetical protein